MKKILSFLLIFILCLNICVVTFATDKSEKDYSSYVELLSAIGITESDIDVNASVTRNEFSKLIYFLAGFPKLQSKNGYISPFSDVSSDDPFLPYISAVKSMNLISGYSDNTFRGNENISFNEALTVTVRLLGYSKLAEAKGGYPTGYNMIAKEHKLTSGMNNIFNGMISYGELAVLFVNALEAPVYEIKSVSSDNVTMKADGTTLMEASFGIHMVKGVMEAHELTGIKGNAVHLPPESIVVDGYLIHSADSRFKEYLGYNVKAYCKTESDKCELVYICENAGYNTETELKAEDISDISGYSVYVEDSNGKVSGYRYNNIASIIYNGSYTSYPFDLSMIAGKEGSIRMIDNNKDNICDVIFVNLYKTIVAGAVDGYKYKVYDNYDKNLSITLDTEKDEPYVLIFDESGNEVPFSKITSYSVLTTEETLDDAGQDYIRVIVSSNKISGKIESWGDGEKGKYIVIDGNTYNLSSSCYENCKPEISAGKYVEIGLNAYSDVAYVRPGAGEISYGYVIAAGRNGSFEGDIVIKIYLLNDSFKTYTLADNLSVDGELLKKDNSRIFNILNKAAEVNQYVNGTLPDGMVIPSDFYAQVIRFSCNENEEINLIDTVLNTYNGDNSILGTKKNISGNNRLSVENFGTLNYKTNGRNFGGKMIIKAGVSVFRVPNPLSDDLKNEEMYAIADNKLFTDNSNHNISSYYDGKEQLSGSVFLVKSNAATSVFDGESALGILSHYTTVMGSDGQKMKRLYIFEAGKLISVDAPESLVVNGLSDISELKSGDMIYYTCDINNQVEYMLFYYRALDNSFNPSTNRGTDWADPRRIVAGYVNEVYEDGFSYKVTDNIADMYIESDYNTAINGGYPVIVYNRNVLSDRNRITIGNYKDLMGFAKVGEDCSRIVIQQRYTQTKMVYIIK